MKAQEQVDDESEIQVYIGEENRMEQMKDCSVVTASYDLGDGLQGTIGIIGPKRMDYEKVMDSLKTVKATLNVVFGNGPGDPEHEIHENDSGDSGTEE